MGEIILNEHHLLPPELATVATHFFAAHPVPVPPVCVCVWSREGANGMTIKRRLPLSF